MERCGEQQAKVLRFLAPLARLSWRRFFCARLDCLACTLPSAETASRTNEQTPSRALGERACSGRGLVCFTLRGEPREEVRGEFWRGLESRFLLLSVRSMLADRKLPTTVGLQFDVDDLIDVEVVAELFIDVDQATGALELVEDDGA